MSMPVVIICGASGSGKDTVASILREDFGAVSLAMSDPMKRFCARVLGFTHDALWGDSELRNTLDTRYPHAIADIWGDVWSKLAGPDTSGWLAEISRGSGKHMGDLREGIRQWELGLHRYAAEHGGLTARFALQTLGTEFGRELIGADTWIDYALDACVGVLEGSPYHATEGLLEQTGTPVPFAVITDGRFPNEVLRVKEAGGVAVLLECQSSNTQAAQEAGVRGHASEKSLESIPLNWFDAVIANDKRSGIDALRDTVERCFSHTVGNGRVPVYYPAFLELEG